MIIEVNAELNKRLEKQRREIEALRSEAESLHTQRRFLLEEARSFRRIAKEMTSPCHLFFQNDRVVKVMNAVRDEMSAAEARKMETHEHRSMWKAKQCDEARMKIWLECQNASPPHELKAYFNGATICKDCHAKVDALEKRYEQERVL